MDKGVKRIVLSMTLVSIGVKALGLFRDVILAKYYGTSSISDAYLIAISVPTFLFYYVGHAISTTYMPIYAKALSEGGECRANCFSNCLVCYSMLLCTLIVALLFAIPKPILRLFAAGFDEKTLDISTSITRISAVSIYCMSLVSIASGYLHFNGRFLVTTTISIPRNLFLIASVVISYYFGYAILGIGILFAYIGELLILLPAIKKSGYSFRPNFDYRDRYLKQALHMVGPVILGVGVSQINKVVDKSMASIIVVGGVSALNYASVVNTSVQEILIASIVTVLFARVTALVSSNNHSQARLALHKAISYLGFILLPVSAGIFLLARPLVVLLFARGNFGGDAIALTCRSLQMYALGILFMAQSDVMVKVFYAYRDTKTPTAISLIAIIINIVLNIILSRLMGISGLALATSISAAFRCIALFIRVRQKVGELGSKVMAFAWLKMVTAVGVMSFYTGCGYRWASSFMNQLLSVLVTILVSAVLYLGLCYLLNVDALKDIIVRVKHGKSELKV